MTCYVGDLGGMVPIPCMSALDVSAEERVLEHTNLAGIPRVYTVRSSAPGALPSYRAWSMSRDAVDSSEWAELRQYLRVNRRPLRLVTCDAANQNLLTPVASDLVSWRTSGLSNLPTPMGPRETTHGMAMVTAQLGTVIGAVWYSPVVPVLPGVPVTAAVHYRTAGTDTARLRLRWTNAVGLPLAMPPMGWVTGQSTFGPLPRLHVTATPPAGAAGVRPEVDGRPIVGRVNVTWSDGPMPWSDGKGAERVRFAPATERVILAVPGRGLSSGQLVAREVG